MYCILSTTIHKNKYLENKKRIKLSKSEGQQINVDKDNNANNNYRTKDDSKFKYVFVILKQKAIFCLTHKKKTKLEKAYVHKC